MPEVKLPGSGTITLSGWAVAEEPVELVGLVVAELLLVGFEQPAMPAPAVIARAAHPAPSTQRGFLISRYLLIGLLRQSG
jgi:hypothetical protein